MSGTYQENLFSALKQKLLYNALKLDSKVRGITNEKQINDHYF